MESNVILCLTFMVFLGSASVSAGADPVKDACLLGTTHSHSAVFGQCSDTYESGNYETALYEWEPLAKSGNAFARFNLGQMYLRGQGVPLNYKEAVKWYRMAAEQEHTGAQYYLGLMYEKGEGVFQDYVYAHMWFDIANSHGVVMATGAMKEIAENMTVAQINRAQDLAQKCVAKEYKEC